MVAQAPVRNTASPVNGRMARLTPTSDVAERENSTSPIGSSPTSHFEVALEPANSTVAASM